ncbi:hypothetical protein A176_007019 [Myxococcus hansupus]|uniref:Vitellogenin domain-containing protein n=1 Tax=Pseudomyxococcus hansupus TaxID=1297742 RepID=A0A0H4XNZ9_9BACT|nr:HEAT repeat domain-containing protein [Myxococcus hansupus]AKQ70107.1 hypothetical protein A176_007019 [Myxococcus hansupus]
MSSRLKSLVLLLAVLVGVIGLWRAGSPDARAPTPGMPRDTAASSPQPEDLRQGVKGSERVLTVGHRLRYTFDLDVRTSTQPVAGARTLIHTGWSGLFELTYLGVEGEQHLFAGLIVPTRVELAGGEPRALEVMFERPFYVAQDARGQVVAVHFDAAQDMTARRLVRRLLAATQFVAEDGARWSTEESDTRGDFESEYRAGGSANTYVKTKRRYLRAAPPVTPRLQGHLAFTLFTDGHVKEAAGSDVVEWGGGEEGAPRSREETRVALLNVGVDYQLSSLRPFHVARTVLQAERLTDSVAKLKPGPVPLRGETLIRLMATRNAREATPERLAMLFRHDSTEVNRAAELLRQGKMEEALSERMVAALARAGTPDAQRALMSVLEAPSVRPGIRAQAVRAVGTMEHPSLLLADALSRALEEAPDANVRDATALSMGALSKGLALAEPGRSKALVDELLRYCRSGTPGPRVCLAALARAGSPTGMTYVRSAMLHPDATVRGASTDALRALPGAPADALLDQMMLKDSSAHVRANAVKALAHRVVGAHLEALATVLRTERNVSVRMEVVRVLGAVKHVDAPAQALLRDAAEHDASSKVRELAAALLGE